LPPDTDWTQLDLEVVKDQARLPGLVVRSRQVDPVLRLQYGNGQASPSTTVLVERALIRVKVHENGTANYQARFRIGQLNTNDLEVELPAPAAGLLLQINLDDKEVPRTIIDSEGRVVRLLNVKSLIKPNSILELVYESSPVGATVPADGLLRTLLEPPVLRGVPGHVLTRWQVDLPSAWVVLSPEGGPGSERAWSFRRGLLTPRLTQTSADLERWLLGPDGVARGDEGEWNSVPSLLCWRGGLEPVTVVHVPQQGWLLICSLSVLMLGMGIWLLLRKEEKGGYRFGRVWLAAGPLALAVVLASVFWPTVMTAVAYGSQPGLLVLILACLGQALLQERRRRQLVFLPSFSRNRGSSLVRNKSSTRGRPHGEPSTVDVPRPT